MKLGDGLYLVGGGAIGGFGLTPAADAHVYALDAGGELALIDCGIGTAGGIDALLATVRADGLDPSAIRTIFLTHAHADHAGAAAGYRRLSGARVVASPDVAAMVESADMERSSFRAAQAVGILPADYELEPCPVDRVVADGEAVSVGSITLVAVATPGHSAGHTAWLSSLGRRSLLFSGDAVFALGRVLLQAVPDCDLAQSAASIRKLMALDFDALLPGHGAVALRDGRDHVAMAIAALDALRVPPNLA